MKPAASLYNFLNKLIDYAGLFPPAKLEIEPSLKNYAEYIQSTDKWMMSQFIIPVSRLDEISTEVMEKYSKNSPLNLTLISKNICNDIGVVNRFVKMNNNSVIFTGYESQIVDLATFPKYLLGVYICSKNFN